MVKGGKMTDNALVNRRIGILVNYLSLAAIAVFVHLAETRGLVVWEIVVTLLLVAVVVVTFIQTQVRTRLWNFVHARADRLDERELEVTHEALRRAYAIFTVTTLLLLLFFEVFFFARDAMMPRDLIRISFVFLLYLAHTLPAAVIAWSAPTLNIWRTEG